MNRLAVAAAATVFAIGAVASAPEAEARRGWGFGGGLVAAAVIGGIAAAVIASRHRHRHYAYYPRRTYAYSSAYYAPRYHYRRHHW